MQAARLAIRHHFERAGIDALVKGCRQAIIYNRIEWPLPTADIQLLVYGEFEDDLEEARSALSGAGEHLSLNITPIVGTGSQPELIAAINEIVSTSSSDFLCLMDARLRPVNDDWLQRLTPIAARAEVGVVTGKLLESDGRLVCGPEHQAQSDPVAEPPLWLEREDSKGYIASLCLDQEVRAAPPALLIAKTSLLRQLQGLPTHCDDLDAAVRLLCRRITELGHSIIWSPHVLFRYVDDEELSPSGGPTDDVSGYGASIPARLAANANSGQLEWEVVWKEGAE